MGENLKISRKRCKLPTIQMAERADISRFTLFQIELGNPSVASDAYFNLMRVLGLQDDFLKLAVDDELNRRLQDFELKIETDSTKQNRYLCKCVLGRNSRATHVINPVSVVINFYSIK